MLRHTNHCPIRPFNALQIVQFLTIDNKGLLSSNYIRSSLLNAPIAIAAKQIQRNIDVSKKYFAATIIIIIVILRSYR